MTSSSSTTRTRGGGLVWHGSDAPANVAAAGQTAGNCPLIRVGKGLSIWAPVWRHAWRAGAAPERQKGLQQERLRTGIAFGFGKIRRPRESPAGRVDKNSFHNGSRELAIETAGFYRRGFPRRRGSSTAKKTWRKAVENEASRELEPALPLTEWSSEHGIQ